MCDEGLPQQYSFYLSVGLFHIWLMIIQQKLKENNKSFNVIMKIMYLFPSNIM